MRIHDQDFELTPIDRLKPHPDNPRRGDLDAIARSIQTNGFYGAVVAQRSTGHVLAGNHRLEAARREGAAEIPCFWLDIDDSAALRILSADNRTSDLGGYDQQALAELLTRIQADSGTLDGSGYSQEAFDAVVAAAGDAVLEAAGKSEKKNNIGDRGLEFRIIVDCESEAQQGELLARFESEALKCRPLIS